MSTPINWNKSLWDTDGYQHIVIAQNATQVVTRIGIAFTVWDKRTGQCVFPQVEDQAAIGGPHLLRNHPLTEDEQRRVACHANIAWQLMHQDAGSTMYCVAQTEDDGLHGRFSNGPFGTLEEAKQFEPLLIFRVSCGETPVLIAASRMS